jgi:hypothetical protein
MLLIGFSGYLLAGALIWISIRQEIKETQGDESLTPLFVTCVLLWPIAMIGAVVNWIIEKVEEKRNKHE